MNTKNYIFRGSILAIILALLVISCKQEKATPINSAISENKNLDTLSSGELTKKARPKIAIIKNNIVDRLSNRPQLSQFSSAIRDAQLDSLLMISNGPFTIFVVEDTYKGVLNDFDKDKLAGKMWPKSFVVEGYYSTPEIYKSFSSLQSQTTFTAIDNSQIQLQAVRDTLFFSFVSNGPRGYLSGTDLFATNGVIHTVQFLAD